MLLFETWAMRVHQYLANILKSFCKAEVEPDGMPSLRASHIHQFIVVARNLLSVAATLATCYQVCSLQATLVPYLRLSIGLSLVWLMTVLRPSQRQADAFIIIFSYLGTLAVPFGSANDLLLSSTARNAFRTFMSVSWMRSRETTIINFSHMLVTCWTYCRQQTNQKCFFCLQEIWAWLLVCALCVFTERWFKDLLRSEAVATTAKNAATRLVSSYCDAVVRLGPNLRILQATPQLAHILCPSHHVSPEELEAALFSDYLSTASGKERYSTFMANTPSQVNANAYSAEGAAAALHVNLRHPLGSEVSVELVHVCLDAPDVNSIEHWIAIREIRADGAAPDESLFQGNIASLGSAQRLQFQAHKDQRLIERQNGGNRTRTSKASSSTSSSSNSSSSSRVSYVNNRRKLLDLAEIRIRLALDDHTASMSEYSLCFTEDTQTTGRRGPQLDKCIVGAYAADFTQWLERCSNELMWDPDYTAKYHNEIWLRPPTSACVSSKVTLCAASVTLKLDARDEGDDNTGDVDSRDEALSLDLHFSGISQVVKCRPGGEQTHTQLETLFE